MADGASIGAIQGHFPSELPRLGSLPDMNGFTNGSSAKKVGGPGFGETLGGLVQNVDSIQKNAHEATRRLLTGEIEDVHQVMVAMEEAQTSFHLMMEVRNKIVDAYREVMRMQV
jgi:flagellar hook-basal body complex protein FliE